MRGRVVLGLTLALLAAVAGAAAGDPGPDGPAKRQIDARIDQLRAEIAQENAHEGVLTSQLSEVTAQLRAAQTDVDRQQSRLSALESELAAARERLAGATVVARDKTSFHRFAQQLEKTAQTRLEQRLRELYMHGRPDTLSVLLSASSFSQLLDDVEYAKRIGRHDQRITNMARRARVAADRARRDADLARACSCESPGSSGLGRPRRRWSEIGWRRAATASPLLGT